MSITVIHRLGGGATIDGWIPGYTKAVITHRGTDGIGDQGPWTRIYTDQVYAMHALQLIELYENIELVSAELVNIHELQRHDSALSR